MNIKIWLKKYVLQLLGKIRRLFLGKFTEAILYKTKNNLYFLVGSDDTAVGRKLAFYGENETSMINELGLLLNKDSTVIVLGVHVGTLLIPLSFKCKNIFGFEANPVTYKLLNDNLYLNKISNAQIVNIALGDHIGKMDFYANKSNSGGSKIKPANDKFYMQYDEPDIIKVDMEILDNYHFDTEQIDLMIIDIEGGEYNAFKGMKASLPLIKNLQVEYVPKHLKLISKVDNETFFSVILTHFSSFKIIGKKEIFPIEKLLPVIKPYWDQNASCDILFSK